MFIQTILAAASLLLSPISGADAEAILTKVMEEEGAPAAAMIVVTSDSEPLIAFKGIRRVGFPDEVTTEDVWHIGSNGKAMTATLAMALIEDGKISLESTVDEVLGERMMIHPGWANVTLAQLLSHRSGAAPNAGRLTALRYIMFGAKDGEGASKDRRKVLAGVLREPPESEPGAAFIYSNLGYTIAGLMLAEAAGTHYEAALAEHVWQPLGMEGITLGVPSGGSGETLQGHMGRPAEPAPVGADNPTFMSPAGTFSLPLDAYARFLGDQLRGQMGADGTLLEPKSYALLGTPPDELESYALGWGVNDGRLQHSGSNTMWFATSVIDPELGIAVSILTNSGASQGLMPHIEEVLERYEAQ